MSRRNCSSDHDYDKGCGCGCGDSFGGFGTCVSNGCGCFSCCDYSCVLSSIYNVYTLQYLASILRTFLGCGLCGGNTGFGCGGNCGCCVTTTC